MYHVKLKKNYLISKVQQIVNAVIEDIEKGVFPKENQLPSINQFSKENNVARDTVEKAYHQLRKRRYIIPYQEGGITFCQKIKKR